MYVHRAKRTRRVVPVGRVIPNFGGKHLRAYRRPFYAMRAVSRGANMPILTISGQSVKRQLR